MKDLSYYKEIIKEKLSKKRFEHSLRVAETALEMAKGRGLDEEQVHLAALLHDYAKDLPSDELLRIGREKGIILYKAEEVQPDLLHGPVGAWLLKQELEITDEAVLQAIRYHTTGHYPMTELDKIIYLADLLEPGRTYEGIASLRAICAENIDKGLLFAFDSTLRYVLERKMLIHPLTVEARNWLLLQLHDNFNDE